MIDGRIAAVAAVVFVSIAQSLPAQSFGDWNRKITAFSMTASAGGPPGTCDVSVEWQYEVLTAGALFGDLTTEVVLQVNGLDLASHVQIASDIGASAGGGDPALCPVAMCSGTCGTVVVDTSALTMDCAERSRVCRCQSALLTAVFPGVPFTPGDDIVVLLRPAPGALPDPVPEDDSASITFGSWNRRMKQLALEPSAGGPQGVYDVHANWVVDLENQALFAQEIGVEIDLIINGTTQATNTTEDCVIWDIMNSGGGGGFCETSPDGTPCGSAVVSDETTTPTCDGDRCSVPPLTSTFPGVALQPGDEIMVLLRPARGALPEPDTSDDNVVLVFGSWNRRMRQIGLEPTAGGPPDTYDVTAEWVMDFEGQSVLPAELGVEVELRINGVPRGGTVDEDCLIWDIMDSGGSGGDCAASGAACGDLEISGQSAAATVDGLFGPCSSPPFIALFPGVPLQPGDEIMVLLRPAPGALPDAAEDDDIGILVFGSWNRKLVAVDVSPTAGGGPNDYDVTAEVVVELTGNTNVLLPLGIATEPYADESCCQEACCCPICSCSKEGCGGGEVLTEIVSLNSRGVDCAGPCDIPCAIGCNGDADVTMSCDPDDCMCRSETFTLVWTGMTFEPDDLVTVVLLPAPGALPELPGFPDDDSQTVPLPGGPCGSIADCADLDDDGIRDDGCLWWECVDGECLGTASAYADMGGNNGACPPDGSTDGNDRFHALNCFSDHNTLGQTGYSCEDDPPAAFNVDAAGLGSPCSPDGACDGNDAFAALNAFDDSTTCSCAMGPAPAGSESNAVPVASTTPVATAHASLRLEASHARAIPGDIIRVDVFLDTPLDDLRGYQLHAGVRGGENGTLELLDISILDQDQQNIAVQADAPPRAPRARSQQPNETHATPSAAPAAQQTGRFTWSAFNIKTHQMVAGMDRTGIAMPGGAYLATFTYRVGSTAAGTFAIELLHDDLDPSHRTVLFPTPANGRVAITEVRPAVVQVQRIPCGSELNSDPTQTST